MPATRARPAVQKLDQKQLVERLDRHDRAFRARWLTLIVLGFCVLWIGPVLFACLIWLLHARATRGGELPWMQVFWWCVVVGIPLLFLLEWATRGKFFEDAMDDASEMHFGGGRAGVMAVITEISLWGPRMVIGGTQRLIGAARVGSRHHHGAAAAVLAVLLRYEDGQRSGEVMLAAGIDADAFGDALAYLTFHDITDISKDGSRLWILSAARKRLTP